MDEPWKRSLIGAASGLCVLTTAGVGRQPAQTAQPVSRPVQEQSVPKDPAEGEVTAKERLRASADLYRTLATYRDTGTESRVIEIEGKEVTDRSMFSTAFERGGRFRWEFRRSASPGGELEHTYTVWSSDRHVYDCVWTATGSHTKANGFSIAIPGPSGGGSAVLPLLQVAPSTAFASTILDMEDLTTPVMEVIDEVECWRIEGVLQRNEYRNTLWLDNSGLIRKIVLKRVVDPARSRPDSTEEEQPKPATTTIVYKPVINELKVDDVHFAPANIAPQKAK